MSARRSLVVVALLVAVGGVALVAQRGPAGPPRCPRCNVVLVTFDSLRADRLGFHGYLRSTSPHLDALARRSAVFARNLSQSGSTIASVPSIHTGRFPHVDLLLDNGVLRSSERTLAEMLRDAGYATGAVIAHEYARCRWGACQGFEVTDDTYVAPEAAERTAERALAVLARLRPPFFLWVHVRQPHFPYDPTRALFAAMYGPDAPGPTFYEPGGEAPKFALLPQLNAHYARAGELIETVRLFGRQRQVTPTVVRQLAAMYDGSIREGDGVLGRLLAQLTMRDEARRTVVIAAADHGESLGNHALIDHNLLWYDVLHTPLIVHVPGADAMVDTRPTMNVDILPTALQVLGLPPPERSRGLGVFGPRRHTVQFAESSSAETIVRRNLRLLVARNRQRSRAPAQLFDLSDDPREQRDLALDRPAAVGELEAIVDAIRRHTLAADPTAPDTDVERKLKALGYIQ